MVLLHLAKELQPHPQVPETPQAHSGGSVRVGPFSYEGRAPDPRLCVPSSPPPQATGLTARSGLTHAVRVAC